MQMGRLTFSRCLYSAKERSCSAGGAAAAAAGAAAAAAASAAGAGAGAGAAVRQALQGAGSSQARAAARPACCVIGAAILVTAAIQIRCAGYAARFSAARSGSPSRFVRVRNLIVDRLPGHKFVALCVNTKQLHPCMHIGFLAFVYNLESIQSLRRLDMHPL